MTHRYRITAPGCVADGIKAVFDADTTANADSDAMAWTLGFDLPRGAWRLDRVETCSVCKGSEKTTHKRYCEATGIISREVCPDCNGSGEIMHTVADAGLPMGERS